MSRYIFEMDAVGQRQMQWAEECPEIDTSGMAILGRMRWITLQVRPAIEAVFAEHGLDSGEFDVIATLLRSGAPYCLRPTELYHSLMISSGGLTDRLNRLVKAGLVERNPSPDDARSLLVTLTTKGQLTARKAFEADMKLEATFLGALNADEQGKLAALLAKLAHAVATNSNVTP